ncbi:MAG: hypothetical protein H0V83_10515 [Rubrobacter sp.]|nr:hypothetical protein [Rubrobacter sp.]
MSNSLTSEMLRGYGIAVLLMTFFGAVWAALGLSELHGVLATILYSAGVVIAVLLLVGGVYLLRVARRAPHGGPAFMDTGIRRRFNQIGVAEGIGIGVAVFVCMRLGHPQWIPAIVAFIVGLHFFPLARLFRLPLYHVTGAVLCLLAAATLFVAVVLNAPDSVQYAIPGLGAATVLWATSAILVFAGSGFSSGAVSASSEPGKRRPH